MNLRLATGGDDFVVARLPLGQQQVVANRAIE
jgi:hypothetical protein